MSNVKELAGKTVKTLTEEGVFAFFIKMKNFIKNNRFIKKSLKHDVFQDVLFINGCAPSVPHPARYRVTHQREQLLACGVSSGEVYYEELTLDMVRFYRLFIFFRCPHTDTVEEFIQLAKKINKKVFFDVDDLVIDTKYTDQIALVNTFDEAKREIYDDGVRRMGRTLQLCDGAITTTQRLKTELEKYVPEVFINRNTASEVMYSLSERAIYKRDILPYLEKSNISIAERGIYQHAIRLNKARENHISLGYFSGSLTHNQDFLMILTPLVHILKTYPQVRLHLVGELDLPEELKEFSERIIAHPFVDWKKLPDLISQVDINLAPLEDTIFNEAKSENKWVEAALVKVPTIASAVGAFATMIEPGETGILCKNEDDWKRGLITLITDQKKRREMAEKAYQYCTKHCVSIYTGYPLTRFLRGMQTTNIAFVLPSLHISGGLRIILQHAAILQEAGSDVTLLNVNPKIDWYSFGNRRFPVLWDETKKLKGRFDKAVATMWTTTRFLEEYPNIKSRFYLVQNYETDFYPPKTQQRIPANASYVPIVRMEFLTISRWCKEWLLEKFGQSAKYAPNGITKVNFPHHKRELSGKIRILIEGDCSVAYKNVDEAFAIVGQLDLNRFEIWYMSYNAAPKSHYHVDRFLSQVPYEEVPSVYQQCHILLKTSILESFSLPPLEMMATGGFVVAVPNGGNQEYLVHEDNCLLYPQGDIEAAVQAIDRICNEEELRERLFKQGVETATRRDWERIRDDVVSLYLP